MSKCDVDLIGLYGCIFQDATRAYPALEKEFSKDYSTLRRAVETRGLRLITVDLVACGKHLDRCLAQGQYNSSGLPLTKRSSGRTQAPKFLRGLWLLIFDDCGRLKDDPDITAVFFLRQIYLFGKKAAYDCDQAAINREVDRLIDHDVTLPQVDETWNSTEGDVYASGFETSSWDYSPDIQALPSADEPKQKLKPNVRLLLGILDTVSGILTSALGSYDPAEWRFKHGPGAVSEGPRSVNKYCWPSWEPHLENEFPIADYGFHNYASWVRQHQLGSVHGESHVSSRLVSVPKTVDTPRLIAAEPVSKQWCQQNLLNYFCERTKKSWISKFVRFDDQTLNQELCLKGSLGGDVCTIDLKAASDSVSCWFVGNLFRRNPRLLRALRAVRTRHLSQRLNTKRQELISLRKYSMMGSAVTFPIESLGFLAIVLSGVLYSRRLSPTERNIREIENVSVFGDDLVIPKDSWDSVVALLEACCFQVNRSKSFSEGNFRESCGVDAFRGWSITPAYWRGPYTEEPESRLSLVGLRNHLYSRWLMLTSKRIDDHLRKLRLPYVACHSGAVGLHSRPLIAITDPVRYCCSHHVWKARVVTVTGQGSRLPFNDNCALHQYFTERPSPFTKWENGVQSRVRMSMRRRWVPVYSLLG